jgi:hypothetical protein
MGVNFQQKCIVGIEVPLSDITVVVAEATYEDQNRYNPKTGKITGTERVLVRESELKYVFMGRESDYWQGMIENLADELDLDSYIQEGNSDDEAYFCIGKFVGDERDMGRVDLLEGSVEISYLVKLMSELKDILPGNISLHFLSSAG